MQVFFDQQLFQVGEVLKARVEGATSVQVESELSKSSSHHDLGASPLVPLGVVNASGIYNIVIQNGLETEAFCISLVPTGTGLAAAIVPMKVTVTKPAEAPSLLFTLLNELTQERFEAAIKKVVLSPEFLANGVGGTFVFCAVVLPIPALAPLCLEEVGGLGVDLFTKFFDAYLDILIEAKEANAANVEELKNLKEMKKLSSITLAATQMNTPLDFLKLTAKVTAVSSQNKEFEMGVELFTGAQARYAKLFAKVKR